MGLFRPWPDRADHHHLLLLLDDDLLVLLGLLDDDLLLGGGYADWDDGQAEQRDGDKGKL